MPHAKFRRQEIYHGIKIDASAKTEKELEQKIALKKDEIDGYIPTSDLMTVSKWYEMWIDLYKRGFISDDYLRSIKVRLEKYALPYIGAMPLDAVREIHIQRVLNRCQGMSKSHIHKLRINLSEMFAKAVSNRYISHNPCAEVKQPDGEAGTHRALTDDELHYFLLATHQSENVGIWALFLLGTGIRPQESVPLKWRDIDAVTRRVHIHSALKTDGSIGTTKTASGVREVPIPTKVYERLNTVRRADDDYVFAREGDRPLTHDAIKYRWRVIFNTMQELAEEDGKSDSIGDDLTPYCLRHTYCTDLLRSGVPMQTAKNFMGHSSIAMVDTVYGHHTEDQTLIAEKLINAYYAESGRN